MYNNLWKISNSLDRLLGAEYTPNETYILAKQVEHTIDSILVYFNIKKPPVNTIDTNFNVKSPREVFNESLVLYSTLNKIRERANIKTQNIEMPKEKNITPNSVYNALELYS